MNGQEKVFSLKECTDKNANLTLSITAYLQNESFSEDPVSEFTRKSVDSDDSKPKKPPIPPDSLRVRDELLMKINQLEQTIADLSKEKAEIQALLSAEIENHNSGSQIFIDHISELESRLHDNQTNYLKLKNRKKELKKERGELRKENELFRNKEEIIQSQLTEYEEKLGKNKIRRKALKEHVKELLQSEQNLTQESIELKFTIADLKLKLRSKEEEISNISIDPDSFSGPRSRKNTEFMCNI